MRHPQSLLLLCVCNGLSISLFFCVDTRCRCVSFWPPFPVRDVGSQASAAHAPKSGRRRPRSRVRPVVKRARPSHTRPYASEPHFRLQSSLFWPLVLCLFRVAASPCSFLFFYFWFGLILWHKADLSFLFLLVSMFVAPPFVFPPHLIGRFVFGAVGTMAIFFLVCPRLATNKKSAPHTRIERIANKKPTKKDI